MRTRESAAHSASRAKDELSGTGGGTIAVAFVIFSALLIGPLIVIFSTFGIGPFATESPGFPSGLIPSSGAYFGAFTSPRDGESREDAVRRLESAIGRKVAS
jgi:hypothetical protein